MQFLVIATKGDTLTVWDQQTREEWGDPILLELTVQGAEGGYEVDQIVELTIKVVGKKERNDQN